MENDYSPLEINHLGSTLAGERNSREWLFQNDFKELAALCDVMIDKNQSASKWLIDHEFGSLILFANALNGRPGALKLLVHKEEKVWAAVVYAFNLESNAIEWLESSGYHHYVKFADKLYVLWRKKKRMRRGYRNDPDRTDWF